MSPAVTIGLIWVGICMLLWLAAWIGFRVENWWLERKGRRERAIWLAYAEAHDDERWAA